MPEETSSTKATKVSKQSSGQILSIDELRLSASSMTTMSCPRRWEGQYVKGIRGPSGPEALLGNFVHNVLEEFYDQPQLDRTHEVARNIARDQWDDFITEYKELPNFVDHEVTASDEAAVRNLAWYSISNMWEFEDPTQVKVHSVEIKIEASHNGIPFVGYVDRIIEESRDSRNILIAQDYKTGAVPKPKFSKDKVMQILLYDWGLREMGIEADEGQMIYTREKTIIDVDFTEETRAAAMAYMENATNLVSDCFDTHFHPETSPLCGWCPFVLECPEGKANVIEMNGYNRMRKDAPALSMIREENLELIRERNRQDDSDPFAGLI